MIICIIMIDYDLPKHDFYSYVAGMRFHVTYHQYTVSIHILYYVYTICEYIHIVYILVTFINLPFHYIMNVMQFPIWWKSEHNLMYIHVVIMTKNIRFLTKCRCALNLVCKNFLVEFFRYCSQIKNKIFAVRLTEQSQSVSTVLITRLKWTHESHMRCCKRFSVLVLLAVALQQIYWRHMFTRHMWLCLFDMQHTHFRFVTLKWLHILSHKQTQTCTLK